MTPVIWSVFRIVVLVLVGLIVISWFFQRKMVFPAGKSIWRTPDSVGWPYEDLSIPVDSGTTKAWYIPAKDSRGVLLFSHGNAGTMSNRIESIEIFRGLGFDMLIYDYGGYGLSSGKPSEKRCYADARAMWSYLTEKRGVASDHIVLFGESLGGGVAVQLATEVKPRAIILASTFLSAVKIGQEAFPFLPVGFLLRYRFETDKKIGRISAPILIVHSSEDDIIPFHHGKELFDLAPEPKTFLEIHGDHNEGFLSSGEVYENGLRGFLDSVFGAKKAPE